MGRELRLRLCSLALGVRSKQQRDRKGFVEIFTNAPSGFDYADSEDIGTLGDLRMVSVRGTQTMAKTQLRRYKEGGFFASLHRSDALAFVSLNETMERPSGEALYKEWKGKGSIDLDKTIPIE